jgi:hypothetical protein
VSDETHPAEDPVSPGKVGVLVVEVVGLVADPVLTGATGIMVVVADPALSGATGIMVVGTPVLISSEGEDVDGIHDGAPDTESGGEDDGGVDGAPEGAPELSAAATSAMHPHEPIKLIT